MAFYQDHNLPNFKVHDIPTQQDTQQNARLNVLDSAVVVKSYTSAQIAALTGVRAGTIVLNISVNQFWGYTGLAWVPLN
jgi:hypothetical protein